MTVDQLWTLVVSLIVLVIGTGLSAIRDRLSLDKAKEDLAGERVKLAQQQQAHDEAIAAANKLAAENQQNLQQELDKALSRIEQLESQAKARNAAPIPYPTRPGSWMG